MKTKILLVTFLAGCLAARAAIIGFDLSPAGFDNAVGLSPLNETPPATNSTGSGNEIGSGITFDTDTLTLNLSLGYGSAFGFTDLTGPATVMHIHGPAPTNTPAGVIINLAGIHVAATNAASGGTIIGSVVLTTNQAADLMAGLEYVNIHTALYPGGEIRGQLIPVNVLPALVCPASTQVECAGAEGTTVELTAQVSDADGDALTIVWSANGVAVQTNTIAAGTSTNVSNVVLSGLFQTGTNSVTVSVSDGIDAPVTCTTEVIVVDTTPPTIVSASVSPRVLWPPNHKLVPVQVSVTATDLCGQVTSRIKSITSNQGALAKGSGHTARDWKITGDLTALLRAERSGKDKNGRTYTLTIESTDDAGNSATTTVTVFVPHDQGKHKGDDHPTPPGHSGSNDNGNGGGNGNGNGNGHGKGKNK
jgi:CHRD domain-containing protein